MSTYTMIHDPLAAEGTIVSGINDDGEIVGTYIVGGGVRHGFVDIGGDFTTIDDPLASDSNGVGGTGTYATGVNDSGEVVGYYYDSHGFSHGFVEVDGSYTTLNDPKAGKGEITDGTEAVGVNDSGEVIGTYTNYPDTHKVHSFLEIDGSYQTLRDPLAGHGLYSSTVVYGINNDGDIVGSFTNRDDVTLGFLDIDGSYTTIEDPHAAETIAEGINDKGQIVGAVYNLGDSGLWRSFVETDGHFRILREIPAGVPGADGVNEQGQIVGTYESHGVWHGFSF